MTLAIGFHLVKKNANGVMKNEKIQLRHPAGKKAVRMDIEKYDVLKKAIINCLKKKDASTHTELLHCINENFLQNAIMFDGSVEWYMESVKLDLETNKTIERIKHKSSLKFRIAKILPESTD